MTGKEVKRREIDKMKRDKSTAHFIVNGNHQNVTEVFN
jgi:hypothetical protein